MWDRRFCRLQHDVRRFRAASQRMLRALAPRGPDAEGEYHDLDAVLVHRRLTVIDPVGGGQPMSSPDGNTIIIYNGELYNTEEIRCELRARGHRFRGRSDTEVLLLAFLEWDTDALSRLNGILPLRLAEGHRRLCCAATGWASSRSFWPHQNRLVLVLPLIRCCATRGRARGGRGRPARCCCSVRRGRPPPAYSGRSSRCCPAIMPS